MKTRRVYYNEVLLQWRFFLVVSLLAPASKAGSMKAPIFYNYSTIRDTSGAAIIIPSPISVKGWQKEYDDEGSSQEIGPTETPVDYVGLDQDQQQSNESCWTGLSCDEFSTLTPPHDVIDLVPPPPLPLFLFELDLFTHEQQELWKEGEKTAKKFNFRQYHVFERKKPKGTEEIIFRINPRWLSTDLGQECSLCQWAKGNSSHSLLIKRKPYTVPVNKVSNWNGVLIGVALVSALVGASLTGVLIKLKVLKRIKTIEHGADFKVYEVPDGENTSMPERGRGTVKNSQDEQERLEENKVSGDRDWQPNPPDGNSPHTVETDVSCPDSEELYINAHTMSVIYSDLTPREPPIRCADSVNLYPSTIPQSEAPNVAVHACIPLCSRALMEMYDKGGFVMEDNHYMHSNPCRGGSSLPSGSSSTPSSAYYSDASLCEVQSSRRKKKKKKGDLEKANRLTYLGNQPTKNPTINMVQNCVQCAAACVRPASNFVESYQNTLHSPHVCGNPILKHEQSANPAHINPKIINTLPQCVQAPSACNQFFPKFMLVNNSPLNNNLMPHRCVSNCEPISVLINDFDKKRYINSEHNASSPSNESKLFVSGHLTNSKPLHYHVSDQCLSASSNGNSLLHKSGRDQTSNRTNECLACDYETYRGYSSSEVPSEYI